MDAATAAGVLGVSPDASRADIERAFRRHARLEHPDVTGDPMTFAAVTEARDVLVRAQGWRSAVRDVGGATAVSVARPGFELAPPVLVLLCGLLILGSLVAGVRSTSPFAPVEPLVRSVVLIGAVIGYALTRRRLFGVVSVIAVVATAVATVVWVSFGSLLGALLMAPAIALLLLQGRNRPL